MLLNMPLISNNRQPQVTNNNETSIGSAGQSVRRNEQTHWITSNKM